MPRKGKGGSRTGTAGTAYSNRTDLNGGSATPGGADIRPYGGGESLPLVPTATSGPSAGGAPPTTPAAPAAAPPRPQVLPGQLTALDAPSDRPDEPLTAGLPIGEGPGLEALGAVVTGPKPDVVALVRYLPALEYMQSRPHLSQKTRNLIRMLRASVPPEARMAARPSVPESQEL